MGFGEKELSASNNVSKIVKQFMEENNLNMVEKPLSGMTTEDGYTYHHFKLRVKYEGDAQNLTSRFHRVSKGIVHVMNTDVDHNGNKWLHLLLDTQAESQEDHPDYE